MASIRELRRKIKSVKSTQQITKAMKLVAAARLNKAQERILQARPFAIKMENLIQELAFLSAAAQEEGISAHPLMQKRNGKRVDVVLITADRGLCGGFNTNLIRRTLQLIREHSDREAHLWVVGRKGRDFFRRTKLPIEKEYINIFTRLGYRQAEVLGDDLIKHFRQSDTREIIVIYNEFKSRLQQNLVAQRLLPLEKFPAEKPKQDFLYEPGRAEILDGLLPRFVKAQLYRILLESASAELAARMTAMDSATNNATDLIYSLTLTMNKVRQSNITKELSEIVSGADALQTA